MSTAGSSTGLGPCEPSWTQRAPPETPIDQSVTATLAAINSGTTFTAQARPKNPLSGVVITDASVTAYFFNPSKSPITNPGDRASPDYTVPMVFDSVSRFYLAAVASTGWAAGVWTMQAVAQGGTEGIDTWEWYQFQVNV